MKERVVHLLRERLSPEQRRFIKFCVVGASGVFVNLGFVWVGLQLFASLDKAPREAAASALGIVVSVFGNFVLNSVWTWGDRDKGTRKRDLLGRVALYYLASSAAIGIQFGVAQLLALGFGMLIYAAQAIGILAGTVVNYVMNHYITFRERA